MCRAKIRDCSSVTGGVTAGEFFGFFGQYLVADIEDNLNPKTCQRMQSRSCSRLTEVPDRFDEFMKHEGPFETACTAIQARHEEVIFTAGIKWSLEVDYIFLVKTHHE